MIAHPGRPQPEPDEIAALLTEVVWPSTLQEALFDPASWHESLEAYAQTTHLAVTLVDAAGHQLGACLNPQPTWSLLHTTQAASAGCPFTVLPAQPCSCVAEALAAHALIWTRERTGLVHCTVPLELDDQPLGALLAGQVFDQYPEHLVLERTATHLGLQPGAVWRQARLEYPVRQATLQVYGRLLATLGQTFLQTRYHRLRDASRRTALESANEALRCTQIELTTARDRYSDLYDRAPMAYLSLDATGKICEANLTAAGLLGVARDALLGQFLDHYVLQKDQSTLEQHRQRVVLHGSPQSCDLTMRQANGRRFSARLESRMGQDATGHPRHCRTVLIDITAQQQRQAQQLQAQKMAALGTLAGGMAHNFNNILMGVLGYAALVQDAVPQDSTTWQHVQAIIVAGRRAADLTRQILAFSRPRGLQYQPIQLGTLIQETVGLLRASLPSSIDIRTQLGVTADLVLADPTQLQQVILNLGSNAAHAMRTTGGILDVRLDEVEQLPDEVPPPLELQPGSYLRLTIRDTGVGMDSAVMARIFEPFFTTKEVNEGTGLGLALVHGIVTSHGGTLTVSSVLGQGTTCSIYLPRAQNAAAHVARAE